MCKSMILNEITTILWNHLYLKDVENWRFAISTAQTVDATLFLARQAQRRKSTLCKCDTMVRVARVEIPRAQRRKSTLCKCDSMSLATVAETKRPNVGRARCVSVTLSQKDAIQKS
jgi:hypothetical protein